jgi:hypothetical protein
VFKAHKANCLNPLNKVILNLLQLVHVLMFATVLSRASQYQISLALAHA